MKKFRNIEFLRIIGCLAIIVFHLFSTNRLGIMYHTEWFKYISEITREGRKAVDMFFILSGFFFAWKFDPRIRIIDFIKNKLIRLYPVLLFLIIVSFFVSLTKVIKWNFYDNLFLFFGLNGTSLVTKHAGQVHIATFWYVSAMLWVMLFYYCIMKYFDRKHVNLFLAVVVFISYSILVHETKGSLGGIGVPKNAILNLGILRALGGIGIGCLIAEWYKDNLEQINNVCLSKGMKIAVTVLEFCSVFFIVNNLIFHKLKYENKLLYIIVFAICLVLFLFKKGYISRFLDNSVIGSVCEYFSKYTYSIYMVHMFIYHVLANAVWRQRPKICLNHPVLSVMTILLLVIFSGVLVYHLVEKPAAEFLKKSKFDQSRL